ADLAENYSTYDTTITEGMLVSLASTTASWNQSHRDGITTTPYTLSTIKKAEKGDTVLGVISTRPGILLGGNTTQGIPVAFSGRVPVLVTNENGTVQQGDYLTLSTSTTGYAMKLTDSGISIGRALSSSLSDTATATIMMVVENKEHTATLSSLEGISFISSATSTLPTTTIAESLTTRLTSGLSVVKEYVAVKMSAVVGYFDTVFARDVYTDTLDVRVICVGEGTNKTCVTKEKLDSLLLLDPSSTTQSSNQGHQSPDTEPSLVSSGEVLGTATSTTDEATTTNTSSESSETVEIIPTALPEGDSQTNATSTSDNLP
ncbi:MAG: hypothetical protein RLZZ308_115, partial [Candidatus Parcubacteria bacterium]